MQGLLPLIIQLISGAVGGNIAGSLQIMSVRLFAGKEDRLL
jgi:hypothetical protein